jgi:hypothetical protein
MNSMFQITLLLGGLAAATLYAGDQAGMNNQGDGGVQAAIRFEKAKDAADARQAGTPGFRAEAAMQPMGPASEGDGGIEAAIQFERAKVAADARQARIEERQAGANATSGTGLRVIEQR